MAKRFQGLQAKVVEFVLRTPVAPWLCLLLDLAAKKSPGAQPVECRLAAVAAIVAVAPARVGLRSGPVATDPDDVLARKASAELAKLVAHLAWATLNPDDAFTWEEVSQEVPSWVRDVKIANSVDRAECWYLLRVLQVLAPYSDRGTVLPPSLAPDFPRVVGSLAPVVAMWLCAAFATTDMDLFTRNPEAGEVPTAARWDFVGGVSAVVAASGGVAPWAKADPLWGVIGSGLMKALADQANSPDLLPSLRLLVKFSAKSRDPGTGGGLGTATPKPPGGSRKQKASDGGSSAGSRKKKVRVDNGGDEDDYMAAVTGDDEDDDTYDYSAPRGIFGGGKPSHVTADDFGDDDDDGGHYD
jgi:hypothetical protein